MTSAAYRAAALTLEPELARWRRLGARPRLWWRDDDARAPSADLDRLLDVAQGRPLALAVIPDGDRRPLALRLAWTVRVTVGQHGVDHVCRSTMEGRRSEHAAELAPADLSSKLAEGRDRLIEAGLEPAFYTPPWNAGEAGLDAALRAAGFTRLSAGAEPRDDAGLAYASTEVDVLRWNGGPRFRGAFKVAGALRKALRTRRLAGDIGRPIGLLTHHLDHDKATWRFLGWFLAFADRRFDWTDIQNAATLHPSPKGDQPDPLQPPSRAMSSSEISKLAKTV